MLEEPLRVEARAGVRLAFGDAPAPGADLTLAGDIDRHNFELLLPGVPVGWVREPASWPLEARGAAAKTSRASWFADPRRRARDAARRASRS